jgi:hypothetical protein
VVERQRVALQHRSAVHTPIPVALEDPRTR